MFKYLLDSSKDTASHFADLWIDYMDYGNLFMTCVVTNVAMAILLG
jgi:hypothetical protein